jgi:hypothetical protein
MVEKIDVAEAPEAEGRVTVADDITTRRRHADTIRNKRKPSAERRLRWGAISWFSVLFFLSNVRGFSSVYTRYVPMLSIQAGRPVEKTLLLFLAFLAVLGIVSLLAVLFKRMFHVLASFVLVFAVSSFILSLIYYYTGYALEWYAMVRAFQGNVFSDVLRGFIGRFWPYWLSPAINLVSWALPFAVYYLTNGHGRLSRSSVTSDVAEHR